MNLLIVNDAVLEAKTMQSDISWDHYQIRQVYVAFSVSQAKEVILAHPVDILLCDIEMPGENGLSLIRWIVENERDIDCILLTCHADFAYAREAVSLNCHEYILLPADYDEIGSSVRKVAQRRAERKKEKELQEYGQNWLEEQNKASGSPSRSPKEIVEECCHYIFSHIGDEELSIPLLAEHFYINAIYLNRIFKKEKNITLNQYIIQERMHLAAHLLENPGASATNVALQVGYSNYPYFSTTFKKVFQCTPMQYIQEHSQ